MDVNQENSKALAEKDNPLNKYFANATSEDIAGELMKKVEAYYLYLVTSGRLSLWRRAYEYYYRPLKKGAQLQKSGQQGEYTLINVNHYRNLLLHLKTMTVQQRPTFEPRAANSDYKSQAQTIVASGLLDYYMREKNLEDRIKTSVEHGLMFGEGFMTSEWDANSGDVHGVDPETKTEKRKGDLRYVNYTPDDVARDFTKKDPNKHDWYIFRDRRNRYTLMAEFPELADKIEKLGSSPGDDSKGESYRIDCKEIEDTDDIPVYVFMHARTSAVPDGRRTEFLSPEITLLDGALPYKNIPVERLAPEEQVGTPFGYTVGFDLIAVQEGVDMLYSTVITNQSTFGVQNVMVPKGHDLSVTQISGGLNLIEYDAKLGKPESLNLTNTPKEIFNFIQQLEKVQETLSGVNSVARGNPEASLKSGAALALVQSQAIQFSMNLQQSYARFVEGAGMTTVEQLQEFATVPRVAMIAGKSQRSMMLQFKGSDISDISRVQVDLGNPLSRTTAGKVQMADTLLEKNLIDSADQYIQVMTTGKLDPMIEGVQAELLNIKAENEEMSEGREVVVMVTDDHRQHLLEHRSVLASPEARRNPQLIKTVTAHILEHLGVLSDPANAPLLAILGQQPIAPPPAPAPGGAGGPGPAPGGGGGGMAPASQVLDATNPVTQQAAKVNMPNMPQNPLQ